MSCRLIWAALMIDFLVLEVDGYCKYTKVVKVEDEGYHIHRTSGRVGIANVLKISYCSPD